ncbi:PDDEXK nuclease domain-containing protein [Epilithonimonas sp. JDS]|uniref:PDDEXK nuclease domain-containing protein n=1 Tax=Epilithonimonas sp. JDS TaxID=2902797 RepID=UPI001E2FCFCE|nr:PDDEXK nuclease domain-containing protein [Epilithonimonas sp. JDS]MCD9856457.1 PDDEXK nuclease domain-containing protein [Epilithonimonas sp. JDS]
MLKENNEQYFRWISDLKQKIQQSQIKAAIQVNSALIEMYWDLGKEISERSFENTYGSGFFKQLSNDLKTEFPKIKGFSESNIKLFERFYLFYYQELTNQQQLVNDFKSDDNSNLQQVAVEFKSEENQNRQQLVGEFPQKLFLIPWGHHIQIFTKCKNVQEAIFYINKTIENGWSRAVLLNMISGNLYQSQGKAITNFSKTLPDYDSELVKQTLKDPYIFDFLNISENFKERELENALIDNIQKFLIELGNGFAFVGKQVEMKVGNQSFFLDLLFYHIKLKRYVVIELKSGEFEPEHEGKLNFYVTSVDKQLRDENDNATVGLIICKTKDDIIAEYSLTDLHKPLGISSYELRKILPDNFKSSLPSIEEIENELNKNINTK